MSSSSSAQDALRERRLQALALLRSTPLALRIVEELYSPPYDFDTDSFEYENAQYEDDETICVSADAMPWSVSRDGAEASLYSMYEIPNVASLHLHIKASIAQGWQMQPALKEVRLFMEERAAIGLFNQPVDVTVQNMESEDDWAHFKAEVLDRTIRRAKDLDTLQLAALSGSDTEEEDV